MKKFLFLICFCLVTSTLPAQGKIEEYYFKNYGEQTLFCQNMWLIYSREGNRIVRLFGSGTGFPVARQTQYVTISDNTITVDETVSENQFTGKDVSYPDNVILQLPRPGQKTRWYDQYEKVYRTAELKIIRDSDGREIEVIKVTWNISGTNRTFHCMQYWGKGYGLIKDDWGTGTIYYHPVMSGQWTETDWYDLEQAQLVREQKRQEEMRRRSFAVKKEFYEMLATSGTLSTNELQEWGGSLAGRTIFRDGVNICEYSKPYVEFADKDNVVETLKSIFHLKTEFKGWKELNTRILNPCIEFSIMNDGTARSRQDISDLFSTVGSSFIIPYKEDADFLSEPVRINSNMLLKSSSTLEYGECNNFEMKIKRSRKRGDVRYDAYIEDSGGSLKKYDCPEKILVGIELLDEKELLDDKWTTVSVLDYNHATYTLTVVDVFSDTIIAAVDVTVPITAVARTFDWKSYDQYDSGQLTVATIIDYDNLDIKSNDSFIKVSDKYPAVYKQQELPNDLKMFIESLMPVIESRDTARIREFLGEYALDKYDINPMYHDDRTEYVGGELHKPDSDIWDALVSAIQAGGYCDSNGFIFPKYEEGLLKYVIRKFVEPHEAGVITDDNVIVRDLPCEKSGVAGRLSKQVVCIDRDFNSDGWCKVRTLDKAIAGYVPAGKIFRPDDMRVIVERDSTGCWKITGFRTWD